VPSFPVVESFDVAKDPGLCFLPSYEGTVMYQFSLQGTEKGFSHRIVVATPGGAHALHSTGALNPSLEQSGYTELEE
jgi:hypothetical protein